MKRPGRVTRLCAMAACALALAACGGAPGEERLESQVLLPAAAAFMPGQGGELLDRQLERLRIELEGGLAGEPERLLAAEAITDGLSQARRPFDWLATGYDLEARLRQIQALADRVVAQLRRNAAIADVEPDVQAMITALNDLRTQLAAGRGGPAPPPLDSLLAQDPMAAARRGPRAAAAVPAGVETPETANEPDPVAAPAPAGPLGAPVAPVAPPDTSGTS